MGTGELRTGTIGDVERAASIAAAGFHDDPLMSWVFPDPAARPGQLATLFAGSGRHVFDRGGRLLLLDDACVAFWLAPGYQDADAAEDEGGDEAPPYPPDVLARLGALGAAIGPVHPHEPHWFLNVLATVPERQGRGLGAEVLRPVLDTCDADGLPAYLQSSNPRNRTLYRRMGFVETEELPVEGGPSLMAMWREPQG